VSFCIRVLVGASGLCIFSEAEFDQELREAKLYLPPECNQIQKVRSSTEWGEADLESEMPLVQTD
jgi:hypothetical protein